MKHKPTLVVLAAGMGSRYGGLKQLDAIGPGGETIIDYSVYDAIRAGLGKVVFIIKKSLEEAFREVVVEKGTTVIWVNELRGKSIIHFTARQVTRACKNPTQFYVHDDGMFLSQELPQGAVASLCIIANGTFDYVVRRISNNASATAEPFPLMGKIIVE